MTEKTIIPSAELTIVAKINKTVLERGILSIPKAYHEPLVQLYPILGEPSGSLRFTVILNGRIYEDQLYVMTTSFSEKWARPGLNIRIALNKDLRKYVTETCQLGEQLCLTLSMLEPDIFNAKLVKVS